MKGSIMKLVNPLEVKLVDNKLVLTRNYIVVKSEEVGTFEDRFVLGEKVRDMGFKKVIFSEEALKFIDIDIARIKAEKAQAKAIAKAEKDAAYQRAKFARQEERAKRKAEKDAAWIAARLARLAEREQIKAEKLAQREAEKAVKLEAKLAKRKPQSKPVNNGKVEIVEARMAA
jgi:hypothetical protein